MRDFGETNQHVRHGRRPPPSPSNVGTLSPEICAFFRRGCALCAPARSIGIRDSRQVCCLVSATWRRTPPKSLREHLPAVADLLSNTFILMTFSAQFLLKSPASSGLFSAARWQAAWPIRAVTPGRTVRNRRMAFADHPGMESPQAKRHPAH